VLTATAHHSSRAARFVLSALAASLGFFGLLRLSWTETQLLLPLTRAQGTLAAGLFGTPTMPVEVTLACSGADALALCLGAVLAYPVKWRVRVLGAVVGVALILTINTIRIGSLGVASSPAWFDALHLYIWPVVLTLAIAGYVFTWMRIADSPSSPPSPLASARQVTARQAPARRFVVLTIAFVIVFTAASALYLESPTVLALAGFVASSGAVVLSVLGVTAHAAENVLVTSRGAFLVTPECISTPLIPIYLAAVGACSTTWPRMVGGMIAALPLFVTLGIARLLVVALPESVASPLFFVHAFYQLLLAAVVVFLAALWRHGGRAALGRGLLGILVGVTFVQLLGPVYTQLVTFQNGVTIADPQGALAFLPAFQVGLYLALWVAAFVAVGWPRFLVGLATLGITQATGLLALGALAGSFGTTAHVRDIRGWAVAGPVMVFAAVVTLARARR
jgi:exosortase/archaeosortase family protein